MASLSPLIGQAGSPQCPCRPLSRWYRGHGWWPLADWARAGTPWRSPAHLPVWRCVCNNLKKTHVSILVSAWRKSRKVSHAGPTFVVAGDPLGVLSKGHLSANQVGEDSHLNTVAHLFMSVFVCLQKFSFWLAFQSHLLMFLCRQL